MDKLAEIVESRTIKTKEKIALLIEGLEEGRWLDEELGIGLETQPEKGVCLLFEVMEHRSRQFPENYAVTSQNVVIQYINHKNNTIKRECGRLIANVGKYYTSVDTDLVSALSKNLEQNNGPVVRWSAAQAMMGLSENETVNPIVMYEFLGKTREFENKKNIQQLYSKIVENLM